jgi:hypothetical protein
MRLSDRGFLAMADAMVCMAILMVAFAVTAGYAEPAEDHTTRTSEFMDAVMGVEVRMSDLGGEDDSLVSLTDMVAYGIASGDGSAMGYIAELGDAYFGEGLYRITAEFGGVGISIGDGHGRMTDSMRKEVEVTSGGTVTIKAESYARLGRGAAVGHVHADSEEVRPADPPHGAVGAAGLAEVRGVVPDAVLGVDRHGHGVAGVESQPAGGALPAGDGH